MVVRARSPRHSSRLPLVLLLLVAVSTSGLFSVPASTSPTATDEVAATPLATDQPRGVRVSNLTDKSVVVTWETAGPTIGSVLYSPAAAGRLNPAAARTAFDLRGTGFTGETHSVRIAGLLPSTDYQFVLSTGGQITDNGGAPYAFRTGPPLLAPLLPDARGGRLVDETGAPAGGCLVFVQVIDRDSAGSRGSSAWLATLSEADGEWLVEVGARTSDLRSEFAYQIGSDSLAVESRCGSRGTLSRSYPTSVIDTRTHFGDLRDLALRWN